MSWLLITLGLPWGRLEMQGERNFSLIQAFKQQIRPVHGVYFSKIDS
jgi:hypothetical protein